MGGGGTDYQFRGTRTVLSSWRTHDCRLGHQRIRPVRASLPQLRNRQPESLRSPAGCVEGEGTEIGRYANREAAPHVFYRAGHVSERSSTAYLALEQGR